MNAIFTMLMPLMVMTSGPMKPNSNEYVLIHGNVKEMFFDSDDARDASNVRCVVYKDDEIYVAFKSDEEGNYLFNLPVGEKYELVFGGDDFVNKSITMDVTNLPAEKKGIAFECNMRVFKAPSDIKQLKVFEEPICKFEYSRRSRKVIPDLEYLDDQSWVVEKAMRKIAKQVD